MENNKENEIFGSDSMTVWLTEPNQSGVSLAENSDLELNKMPHKEQVELLQEIDKEVAILQDEINDKINSFIANHKYSGNLEVIALDKTFLKLSDKNERIKKFTEVSITSPSFHERHLHQQYVFLVPAFHYFEENGTPCGGQGMQPTRF